MLLTLKEAKYYDPAKKNAQGQRPVDVLRKRKLEKNPYETNVQDLVKLESQLVKDETYYS